MYPIEEDVAVGENAYQQILEQEAGPVVESGAQAEMVQRVTDRLSAVAVQRDPEFEIFPWEVKLVDSPTVNAFCLPGGKMVVYTGILPYTQSEAGLAAVMGHEIAHATRRHGIGKMVRANWTGGVAALGAEFTEIDPALLQSATNVLIELPYGRSDELEADRFGLSYMASAGYDPREAVAFWKRMAEASQGAPPEFLSTHPSDERRIAQIESLLPKAIATYERASGRQTPPSP